VSKIRLQKCSSLCVNALPTNTLQGSMTEIGIAAKPPRNFSRAAGFASTLYGSSSRRLPMIPTTENGFEQRFPPSRAILAERGKVSYEERLEQATQIQKQLDSLRSWRERLSPKFRRAGSAGRLLFQIVGAAGYAGYSASMHTLMRLFSGALMAGTWYAIYKIKEPVQPSH